MSLNYKCAALCVLSLFTSCYTFSYELSNESVDDSFYVYKNAEFINTLKPGGVLALPSDEVHVVELANVKAPTLSYKINIMEDGGFLVTGDLRPTGRHPYEYYMNAVESNVQLFIDASKSKLIVQNGFMEVNHYNISEDTLAIKATVKENTKVFDSRNENIRTEVVNDGAVGAYLFERHAQL